jgi:hypothetical protein
MLYNHANVSNAHAKDAEHIDTWYVYAHTK